MGADFKLMDRDLDAALLIQEKPIMLLQVVIMFGLIKDGQIFVGFKISFLASGLVSCWQREMLSDCLSKAHSVYYNFES